MQTSQNLEDIPPPKEDFNAPPPYEYYQANQTYYSGSQINQNHLPSYEEVERQKTLNREAPIQFSDSPEIPTALQNSLIGSNSNASFFEVDVCNSESLTPENGLLGTDILFITAFVISFLFNWIGFLMLTCFCHTIAARYGSLSGFGLSLTKWTLIVKNSTDLASHENSWLWWLIMAFGFLICIRAILQYLSIKRTWRLLSSSDQERLFFFY